VLFSPGKCNFKNNTFTLKATKCVWRPDFTWMGDWGDHSVLTGGPHKMDRERRRDVCRGALGNEIRGMDRDAAGRRHANHVFEAT